MNTTRKEFLSMVGGTLMFPTTSLLANELSKEEKFLICPLRKKDTLKHNTYVNIILLPNDYKNPCKYNIAYLDTLSVSAKNGIYLFYDYLCKINEPLFTYDETKEILSSFTYKCFKDDCEFIIANAKERNFCVKKIEYIIQDNILKVFNQVIFNYKENNTTPDIWLPWSNNEEYIVDYDEAKNLILKDKEISQKYGNYRGIVRSIGDEVASFFSSKMYTKYQILSKEILERI